MAIGDRRSAILPRPRPPLTLRTLITTFAHMRLVMDSDCLIKLTKAGLKERLCELWEVTIPELVRRETVEPSEGRPDAARIRQNIASGRLAVASGPRSSRKGEDAALALFEAGGFAGIGTDDARFIRRLRGLGVPYAVPAVILVKLRRDGALSQNEAEEALEALRPHISADEYASAYLMLGRGVSP